MGRLSEDLLLSPDELEEAKEEQSSPPASLRWFIAVAVALVVGIIAGYQTGRWNVSRIQAQVLSNVVPQGMSYDDDPTREAELFNSSCQSF